MRARGFLWVLLGVLASGTAPAIQEATPEPDQRYRVVDVAPGSALNLRAGPGTASDVVATLAPDTDDLTVTGVRRELAGQVWWQLPVPDGVNVEGTDQRLAWAHSRYLTPQAPARETGFELQCSGTEPFWSLSLKNNEAIWSQIGEAQSTWHASARSTAAGTLGGAYAVRLDDDGAAGFAAVTRRYQFCYDGMSDLQYPYEVLLMTPDDRVFSGCCRRR